MSAVVQEIRRPSVEDLIASVVQEELAKFNLRQKRLLTWEESIQYLNVSDGTLRNFVNNGRIPVVRLTSRPQFDIVDLDRLIEQSKHTR